MHGNWKITIALQPTQKFSLCVQTKQCFAIAYRLEKGFCAFIISANFESDDSLTTRGKKNLAGKNLNKKLPGFEVDFGPLGRKAQALQSCAS